MSVNSGGQVVHYGLLGSLCAAAVTAAGHNNVSIRAPGHAGACVEEQASHIAFTGHLRDIVLLLILK